MVRSDVLGPARFLPVELASAYLKWLSKVAIVNPTAVTMTLMRWQHGSPVDVYRAELAFRHFMRLLNAAAFGNAYRRYGRSLKVIPSLETMADGRLHYHAVLERPPRFEPEEFQALIVRCLDKTACVHREHRIIPVKDTGWLAYVVKPRSKAIADQIIDLGNLQIR